MNSTGSFSMLAIPFFVMSGSVMNYGGIADKLMDFCECVTGHMKGGLAHAMKTLRTERIVGHVHDEIILEAGKDAGIQAICEQMGRTPAWIPGLVLRADGYECETYRKD